MVTKRLHQAASKTSLSEGLVKLVVAMVFVPFPILVASLGGFWLDYYQLNTLPLLTVLGAVVGTLISFLGIYKIITYGHKRRD
ncbi:hypothetical protein ACFLUK_02365 [Chloroflexota bacterium]